MITNPNTKENIPPIAIVHGTTFKGKKCKRTTKTIAKIPDI